MFCRKCGETLLDDDRFCPYCGAQVIERKKEGEPKSGEEVVYNANHDERHFFSERLKPDWNLDYFPDAEAKPKKTDDILVDWQQNILIEPTFKPEKDMSFSEQLQAFESSFDLTKKKIEKEEKEENEGNIAKSTLIFERPQFESPAQADEKLGTIQEDKKEAKAEELPLISTDTEEQQKDKFYTFSQKNAEFQKLLDKEYEKIKAGREETFKEIQELNAASEADEEEPENIPSPEIPEVETLQEKVQDKNEEPEEVLQQEEKPSIEESEEKPVEVKIAESIGTLQQSTIENQMEWEQQAPPFEDERKEKKASVVVVILSIVVVILGLSIAALAVEQFVPNSVPGKTVHTYLEKARDFFRGDSA